MTRAARLDELFMQTGELVNRPGDAAVNTFFASTFVTAREALTAGHTRGRRRHRLPVTHRTRAGDNTDGSLL
jgi:hypothetical protein